jgi:outer membrane protein OmpA-like peptidoglycan-associated protein
MRQVFRAAVVGSLVVVGVSGCATRGWVRGMMGKMSGETDERFASVEGRVGAQDQRLEDVAGRIDAESQRLGQAQESVDGRVKALEGTTGETGELARAARARAEEAFTRADELDGRLTRLSTTRRTRNAVETLQVRFGFDRAELDDRAQTALLPLIKDLRDNTRLSVDLEGYTDLTGSRAYNLALSQRRVEAVRRYLVEQGIAMPRIHAIGLGPSTKGTAPEPPADKRRVTVRLMAEGE